MDLMVAYLNSSFCLASSYVSLGLGSLSCCLTTPFAPLLPFVLFSPLTIPCSRMLPCYKVCLLVSRVLHDLFSCHSQRVKNEELCLGSRWSPFSITYNGIPNSSLEALNVTGDCMR